MINYLIKTGRLGLRNWLASDTAPFVTMGQDSKVMRYFPELLTEADTIALINNLKKHYEKYGYTYFAMDELATGEFVGFTGLKYQTFESEFTPSVDIGWRLKRSAWGKGYATEAAKACLNVAFNEFGLDEVYSFCPDLNKASEAIMKKIGMTYLGTLQHPKVANDSRFKHCVVYRSQKPEDRS